MRRISLGQRTRGRFAAFQRGLQRLAKIHIARFVVWRVCIGDIRRQHLLTLGAKIDCRFIKTQIVIEYSAHICLQVTPTVEYAIAKKIMDLYGFDHTQPAQCRWVNQTVKRCSIQGFARSCGAYHEAWNQFNSA
jgi:hypothetical protein